MHYMTTGQIKKEKSCSSSVCVVILHYGDIKCTEKCLLSIFRGSFLPTDIILIDNDPSSRFLPKGLQNIIEPSFSSESLRYTCSKVHCLWGYPRTESNLYLNIQFRISEPFRNLDNGELILAAAKCSHKTEISPTIHYIQPKHNLGFSAGVNFGIRFALTLGKDSIILLNNDTELSCNTLEILTRDANGFSGIAGAVETTDNLCCKNGKSIIFAGGSLIWREVPVSIKTSLPISESPYKTDFVRGSCMMIPSSVVKRVGFFDEMFFAYNEDVDYAIRVAQKGYAVKIVPGSVIHHKLSSASTTYQRNYLMTSGYVRLLQKHAKGYFMLKGFLFAGVSALFSLLSKKRDGKFKGFVDALFRNKRL